MYRGLVTKDLDYPLLALRWEIQAAFYGFDMAWMLNGLLAELLFGDIMVEIPKYVRNDNSTAAYQVDSPNTVTNEKRLSGFLESNRWGLERDNWLSTGYIPGRLNTSDGLTKSMSSANLGRLCKWKYIFQIATEFQKGEIRNRIPAEKHYIVYHETMQGKGFGH